MTEEQKQLILMHVYSFSKTFITVFIGVWIFGVEQKQDVWSVSFLLADAQASLVSVVRNVYKLLTEK